MLGTSPSRTVSALLAVIRSGLEHDDPAADLGAGIEVDHVMVQHAHAAARDGLADRPRLVGAGVALSTGIASKPNRH